VKTTVGSQVPSIMGTGRHVVGDLANPREDDQDPSNGKLRDVLSGYFGKDILCKLGSFKHVNSESLTLHD